MIPNLRCNPKWEAVRIDGKKKKAYRVDPIKGKAPAGLTAGTLVITSDYDEGLIGQATLYAKYPLKGAEVRKVGDWEQLSKTLQKYKSIDRLVLYFHGTPGSLIIGGVHQSLDDASEKYFKGKKMPKVQQLDLEACSVAESPEKMVPFAKVFDASKVTAWNYFHVGMKITVDVPKGVEAKKMEATLKPFKGYLLENTPTAEEMASKPGKYEIGAEWFRDDLNEDPLPPPRGGGLDPREKTFKPGSRKNEVTIGTEDELKSYVEKYRDDPVRPLEHLTVDMSGMK